MATVVGRSVRRVSRIPQFAATLTRCSSSSPSLQPAYVFDPDVKTGDPDHQAFFWTKTHLHPSTPPQPLRGRVDFQQLEELVKKAVYFSRVFESLSEDHPLDTYPNSLVQNIIRIMLSYTTACPQLADLHVAPKADVTATWWCKKQLLAVRGQPGTLLSSQRSLPQLFDDETVQATQSCYIAPSSVEKVSAFTDLVYRNVQEGVSTRYHLQREFPYCHTLVIPERCDISDEPQLIQKCIVYLFGALATQAIDRHGKEISGKVLPRPECAQGVVTNGNWFSFVWYQLNTLDLSSINDGIKNLVSVSHLGPLYTYNKKASVRGKISDMDTEILQTLSAMLLWS